MTTAAALLVAAPAQAQVTNYTIGGTGSGTMALDLTGGVYTLTAFNYSLAGMTFDTTNSGVYLSNPTTLIVGANPLGINGVIAIQDDFWFFMDPTIGSQTASLMQYGFVGNTQGLITGTTTLSVVTPGVPEPSTWAMMLLGFGSIGFALRRRRQTKLTFRQAA